MVFSWRANLFFSFQISVLPIEPQGGACQELRPRAVHEAVQLCELQDGGLGWGLPVQISVQDPPPAIRGLQALTLPNPNHFKISDFSALLSDLPSNVIEYTRQLEGKLYETQ